MLLQEKQLSNFSPLYFEFSRFSDGSKLNCSPRCRHSLRSDGAKINILLGICNIVSRFFHFGGKYSAKKTIHSGRQKHSRRPLRTKIYTIRAICGRRVISITIVAQVCRKGTKNGLRNNCIRNLLRFGR